MMDGAFTVPSIYKLHARKTKEAFLIFLI